MQWGHRRSSLGSNWQARGWRVNTRSPRAPCLATFPILASFRTTDHLPDCPGCHSLRPHPVLVFVTSPLTPVKAILDSAQHQTDRAGHGNAAGTQRKQMDTFMERTDGFRRYVCRGWYYSCLDGMEERSLTLIWPCNIVPSQRWWLNSGTCPESWHSGGWGRWILRRSRYLGYTVSQNSNRWWLFKARGHPFSVSSSRLPHRVIFHGAC